VSARSPAAADGERALGRRLRLALVFVLAGAGIAAVTGWLVAESAILVYPLSDAIVRAGYVAVYSAVGAYVWYRRPTNRLGPLLAANALVVALLSLNASGNARVWAFGIVLWSGWIAFTAYLYLCFPRGRLESRLERVLVGALAASTTIVWGLALVFAERLPTGGEFMSCGSGCPANPFQLSTSWPQASSTLNLAYEVTSTISLIGIAILIGAKGRSPSRLRRRAVGPLSFVLVATIVEFVVAVFFIEPSYPGTVQPFRVVDAALVFAIPVAMLVGQARSRVFAAVRGGRLAASLRGVAVTHERAQELLRDALGDPTLVFAVAAPGGTGYVDAEGAALALPPDSAERVATVITVEESPIAAVLHDPLLDVDVSVVEGLTATVLLLVENAHLLEEVSLSRRRLLTSAQRDRIRLERDLHDGAAQRLLAVHIRLGLLREQHSRGELADELASISAQTLAALDEIRAVGRGIYPTVLQDFGLPTALRSATSFLPLEVDVSAEAVDRLDPAVEATIYFCVVEALRIAAAHAGPETRATVALRGRPGSVEFEVTDDGEGFHSGTTAEGLGLLSIVDRVEALGGTAGISSTPAGGTTVSATIPTAPRSQLSSAEYGVDVRESVEA
jgi:signal transduction histidine kinase